MRWIVAAALLGTLTFIPRLNAGLSEKDISNEAAAHASVLLSKDISNAEGRRLLALARALQPKGSIVRLVEGYLKQDNAPQPLVATTRKEKLIQEIRGRGLLLLRSNFKNNVSAGKLSLLYLLFSETYDATDHQMLKGLAYLQAYGVHGELSALLEEDWNLKAIYTDRTKPLKIQSPQLDEEDEKMGECAIVVASSLLAQDPKSDKGFAALRFGHHLLPGSVKGILLLYQLQRGAKIEPLKSHFSEGQLRILLLKRCEHFLRRVDKGAFDTHMAWLCTRMAGKLGVDDLKVKAALIRLKKLGDPLEFDDLLQVDSVTLAPGKKRPAIITGFVPDRQAVPTGGGTDAEAGDAITKSEDFVMSKFRSDVKAKTSRKKEGDSDITILTEHVTLTISFDNKMKRPVEGLEIIACAVGKAHGEKKGEYEIVESNISTVDLPSGRSEVIVILDEGIEAKTHTDKSKNNSGDDSGSKRTYSGSTYESFFVVVKDQDGEIIQLKAKDARVRKFALNLPWREGELNPGLDDSMRFDRNGNRLLE